MGKRNKLNYKSMMLIISFLVGILLLTNNSVSACSSFCLKDEKTLLFGNNLDFWTGTARVLINKRGVSKVALIPPGDIPAKWSSKYGSITFNQVGQEFPYQGMNEAGLVVAQMAFEGTKYITPDVRSAISELQWIQYQLDTAESVEQVIASDKNIRICQNGSPLHYLICDRSGNIAVIEYLNGKFTVKTGANLPYPVLTNNAYLNAAAFTTAYKKMNCLKDIPKTVGMSERFGRAAAMLINYKKQNPAVDYAFDILKEVSQPETKYSIVFDVINAKIYFHTKDNQNIRILNMKDFDYSCKTPVLGVDIENKISKGKDDFQIYTIDMNRSLIEKVIKECEFLNQGIGPFKEYFINYPKSLSCMDNAK